MFAKHRRLVTVQNLAAASGASLIALREWAASTPRSGVRAESDQGRAVDLIDVDTFTDDRAEWIEADFYDRLAEVEAASPSPRPFGAVESLCVKERQPVQSRETPPPRWKWEERGGKVVRVPDASDGGWSTAPAGRRDRVGELLALRRSLTGS